MKENNLTKMAEYVSQCIIAAKTGTFPFSSILEGSAIKCGKIHERPIWFRGKLIAKTPDSTKIRGEWLTYPSGQEIYFKEYEIIKGKEQALFNEILESLVFINNNLEEIDFKMLCYKYITEVWSLSYEEFLKFYDNPEKMQILLEKCPEGQKLAEKYTHYTGNVIKAEKNASDESDIMKIETSAGTLNVFKSSKAGASGFYIYLAPKGYTESVPLAKIIVKDDSSDVNMTLYKKACDQDTYTESVSRKDIEAVLFKADEPKSATVEQIDEVYKDGKYNFELTNDVYDEIMFRCDSLEVDDIRINIKACLDYINQNGFRTFVKEDDDGIIWEYCETEYKPAFVSDEFHLLLVGQPKNIEQVSIIGAHGGCGRKIYEKDECTHEIPNIHAGDEIILTNSQGRDWAITDENNPGEIIGTGNSWCRIKVPENMAGGKTLMLYISDKYGQNTNCDCLRLEKSFANRQDVSCENFPWF